MDKMIKNQRNKFTFFKKRDYPQKGCGEEKTNREAQGAAKAEGSGETLGGCRDTQRGWGDPEMGGRP